MSDPHELAIERMFDAPRDVVWRAVTEHLTEWWCPRPWTSEIVALDWASGGRFAITMRGPDGEEHAGDGMLLEVVPETRFVFTNVLGAGLDAAGRAAGRHRRHASNSPTRPAAARPSGPARATGAPRTATKHDAMGFADGWGVCADQLAEVAARLAETANA